VPQQGEATDPSGVKHAGRVVASDGLHLHAGKCKQSANMPHVIPRHGKSRESGILSNRAKRPDSTTPHNTPEMDS
jgi:hypothetical protein